MNMEEYLQRVEDLLRAGRMAPQDARDARVRCGQYIINAGVGHEADAMNELGTPEELAQRILAEYRADMAQRRASGGLSLTAKIILGVCLFPFIISAYAIVFAFVVSGVACVVAGVAVGVVSVFTLLALQFGTFLNFLGSGIVAMGCGCLLALGGIAFCKLCNLGMKWVFGSRRYAA